VIRLGLRYKFIFTLLGFTLIVAVPLGALAIMRFSDELKSQLRVKWETTVKIWSEQLSRESERGLLLGESCSWWGRQWSSEVFYMRVTWESESNQIPNPERRIERIECEYKNPKLTPLIVKHFNQLSAPIEPGQLYSSFGPGFLDIIYATPLRLRPAPTLNLVEGQALIRLGIDLAPIQAHVRRQATLIILVVIGYVVLGILIAFMFYKMILGPAESLTKALQRFKLDPSARAHIATGDELEMLAHEFNAMADALSERNRRLEQMNADLVKANRAKSDFLAMMSHELKTPLHAIRGYSQLLLEGVDGPLTPAQREDLENILNAGDHLLELIDNILRFSKLEASEDRPYFEAVETSTIGEEAVKAVSALARSKGLELSYHVEPCTLIADGTKIKQALINLLSNAIKYTPTGRVTLSGTVRENEYIFSVADTGIGIPEHERSRIFEPFTQLDSSNTREFQGVGLGLAIVKKYVEMHGGRVLVESEVGRGSVFSLVLPLEPAHAEAEPPAGEVNHAHSRR
jgi:signal transduction histidine kinase